MFHWTIIGTTAWSRTYTGKRAVRDELMRPLFAQFADTYTNTATRIIAEDDVVVIECRGKVTTKAGKPYNQTYCYVCQFVDGKVRNLTEYLDTELITAALDPPAHRKACPPPATNDGLQTRPFRRNPGSEATLQTLASTMGAGGELARRLRR